jgi:hypothetical protein
MMIPRTTAMHPMYVRGKPGSRMTLKIDTVSPTKPDWYTFHPAWVSGLFM